MRYVSIHARVKRATQGKRVRFAGTVVSIHARVKRATRSVSFKRNSKRSFNPRPREAGDIQTLQTFLRNVCFNPRPREAGDFQRRPRSGLSSAVSIHARVKRATWLPEHTELSKDVSIHARVKRATDLFFGLAEAKRFQSTPA